MASPVLSSAKYRAVKANNLIQNSTEVSSLVWKEASVPQENKVFYILL